MLQHVAVSCCMRGKLSFLYCSVETSKYVCVISGCLCTHLCTIAPSCPPVDTFMNVCGRVCVCLYVRVRKCACVRMCVCVFVAHAHAHAWASERKQIMVYRSSS